MKKIYLLVYFFLFTALRADIFEISSIEDLLSYVEKKENILFVFDIDNTILEPENRDFGSDQWVDGFCKQEVQNGLTINQAYKKILPIYFKIVKGLKYVPIEKDKTLDILNHIKSLNIESLALTARSEPLIDCTYRHLKSNEVLPTLFDLAEDKVILFDKNTNSRALYFKGTIHCAGNSKGECLKKFIKLFKDKKTELKNIKKIIMIDDKEKNLQDVEDSLKDSNIEFIGLRYSYLDEKVKSFVFKGEKHIPTKTQECC
ncbi:DUF2608 domain-containing protein [Candidatus Dependentiae bacterium]